MKLSRTGPELGVCYYPEQWEPSRWREDADAMRGMGLDWVRIGEFTWAEVELCRGEFTWDWLDEAIAVLGEAGLKVLMCTPTAAPPKWLVDELPEILPVGADGKTRGFGARRHYCFSSEAYLREARRIAAAYGKRYGRNPHVRAWQIDNEFNDHETALSYSPAAADGFRHWLRSRYRTIDTLNGAWGTKHWGMRYGAFEQVDLPVGAVDEPNPAHALDFARYSSDRVNIFCQTQVQVLRRLAPEVPITHNFMAGSYEFDHHAVAASLDFVSFDSYPLGNLLHGSRPQTAKARWLRIGDPDYQGFHCDMYRHQGKGRLWITELQPGPVNWAAQNPSPAEGAVRLWTWLAFAHGAETILFFRWRQAPSGQEQYHAALRLPDGAPDKASLEIARVACERTRLPPSFRRPARVAMVVDYLSRWAARILPQGRQYSGGAIAADWYRAVRELGADVDIIGPESDLSSYSLVLVPDMMIGDPDFASALSMADAHVLLGPRTGSRSRTFRSPEASPPGVFRQLIDLKVRRVESLPEWHSEPVAYREQTYQVTGWREWVESSETATASFLAPPWPGSAAILCNERATYLAMLPGNGFLREIMREALERTGIACEPTGDSLRITHRDNLGFVFNFSDEAVQLPGKSDRKFLIGSPEIGAIDLAVWLEPRTDDSSQACPRHTQKGKARAEGGRGLHDD